MNFHKNKYTKWYFNIISAAKSRITSSSVYIEKHHIIPKSLGGDNSKENLVCLTAREHFICHLLLTRMTSDVDRTKMAHAAWRMTCTANKLQARYKANSHSYQSIRKLFIDQIKGKPRSEETKEKLRVANLGKTVSDEVRMKMKLGQANRLPISEETRLKKSKSMKGKNVGKQSRLGKLHTDKTKESMSINSIVGTIVTLVGVYLVNRSLKKQKDPVEAVADADGM